MLKRLKQTWLEEEGITSRPASPATTHEPMTITPQPTSVPLPITHEPSPEEPFQTPTSGAPKRNRDVFEQTDAELPDVAIAYAPSLERPIKQVRISSSEALRNYLPEILDSKDDNEDMPFMSAITHKDEILEKAKAENRDYSLAPSVFAY